MATTRTGANVLPSSSIGKYWRKCCGPLEYTSDRLDEKGDYVGTRRSTASVAAAVEKILDDLLIDRISRENTAAWARPYAMGEIADQEEVRDLAAWDALSSLALCDLKQPDAGVYKYDKVGVRAWLEQLHAVPRDAAHK